MNERQQKAMDIFVKGYNCSQAVAGAFADLTPYSEQEMLKISASFGGGFARTRNLCGAVSSIGIIVGLIKSNGESSDNAKTYDLTQKAIAKFIEKNKTVNCGELLKDVKNLTSLGKPDERTQEYYKIRPCAKFVMDAVEIIEEILKTA